MKKSEFYMLDIVYTTGHKVAGIINLQLKGYTPAQILVLSGAAILTYKGLAKTQDLYLQRYTINLKRDTLSFLASSAIKVPLLGNWIKGKIDDEVKKTLASFEREIEESRKDISMKKALNAHGTPPCIILKEFQKLNTHHAHHKLSGAVYIDPPEELLNLLSNVFKRASYTNPLHAHWPMLSAMEAEIISWAQKCFGGESGNPGLITHGGTSSIIEAVNIYVQQKRSEGYQTPDIVVPDTAHAAFIKSARITGARLIVVRTNKKTGKVDPQFLKRFITNRTAMIVGSAPSFMNGVCDDIEALGKIALEKKVPFHVDGCLGGFITAFDEEKERKPKLDFRVPGVTSLSADTHKYGFAPKGSSLLLFSAKYKPSIDLEWSGGLYVTKNHLDGSRSGFQIAGLYATLKYFGVDFYQKATKDILALSNKIRQGVNDIDGIYTRGDAHHMVIGISSDTLNIHVICDQMKIHGWSLSRLQNPDGFHLAVTNVHTSRDGFLQEFLDDLKLCVQYAKDNPSEKEKGEAKAYGKLRAGIPPFVQEQIGVGYAHLLDTVGLLDDEKEIEASINQLIDTQEGTIALAPKRKEKKETFSI